MNGNNFFSISHKIDNKDIFLFQFFTHLSFFYFILSKIFHLFIYVSKFNKRIFILIFHCLESL